MSAYEKFLGRRCPVGDGYHWPIKTSTRRLRDRFRKRLWWRCLNCGQRFEIPPGEYQ